MTALRRSPLVVVWAALTIATCAAWYLGHDSAHTVATVLVLVIAFIKVHYIGR